MANSEDDEIYRTTRATYITSLAGLIFIVGANYLAPSIAAIYFPKATVAKDDPVSRFICKSLSMLSKKNECIFLRSPQ